MRKVSEQIEKAFRAGNKKTVGNTMTDGKSVFLHGNEIIRKTSGGIKFTLAGWNTTTTRERVNSISGAGICQKNSKPMRKGEIIDSKKWYLVN